jgi:hypothetical protein
MWRGKENHSYNIYTNQLHEDFITNNHNEKRRKRDSCIAQDAPMISIESTTFSTKSNATTIDNIEEILLLRHRDMKRGQLEALLIHTSIIKKRKTQFT